MKKVSTRAAARSSNISQQKLTIGLDLGDRNSWFCVMDEGGQIQQEQRVRTSGKALQEVFGAMPRSRIALEIGTHSPWISRLLRQLGHEVIVANARKVRLIGESRKKDDRLDARTLARLARIDPELLYPVKHRSEQAQADLTMIRARAGLAPCGFRAENLATCSCVSGKLRSCFCTALPITKYDRDSGGPMGQVRIAMLGSGFVASYYMDGLANVNGHEVVANYSRNPQRAQEFAKRWCILDHSSDLEKLIARDDIDLFIIALPNEAHLPVSLALSKAGRNQVCTKPLGRSKQEAKAMLAAAQDSGALHCYAETEVFSPCVVKARQVIENGGIGRVLWVRSRESHAGPPVATHGWDTHWWDVKKTGGGALLDLGCHCIEAARYFFGKQDPIVEIMAWADRLIHTKTEGEDNALVVLRFASGGIAQCELSWTCKGGLDLRNEVHGDQGSIFTDVTRGTPIAAFTTKSAGHIVEQTEIDFGWTRPLPEEAFSYGYQAEMRHFVECIRDKTPPRETFEDGYIVNSVIEACYESVKAHCWVPFEY